MSIVHPIPGICPLKKVNLKFPLLWPTVYFTKKPPKKPAVYGSQNFSMNNQSCRVWRKWLQVFPLQLKTQSIQGLTVAVEEDKKSLDYLGWLGNAKHIENITVLLHPWIKNCQTYCKFHSHGWLLMYQQGTKSRECSCWCLLNHMQSIQ